MKDPITDSGYRLVNLKSMTVEERVKEWEQFVEEFGQPLAMIIPTTLEDLDATMEMAAYRFPNAVKFERIERLPNLECSGVQVLFTEFKTWEQ